MHKQALRWIKDHDRQAPFGEFKCGHKISGPAAEEDPHWVCLRCRKIPITMLPGYSTCRIVYRRTGTKKRRNEVKWTIPLTTTSLADCSLCKLVPLSKMIHWRSARDYSTNIFPCWQRQKDLRKDTSRPLSKSLSIKVQERKKALAAASSDSASSTLVKNNSSKKPARTHTGETPIVVKRSKTYVKPHTSERISTVKTKSRRGKSPQAHKVHTGVTASHDNKRSEVLSIILHLTQVRRVLIVEGWIQI